MVAPLSRRHPFDRSSGGAALFQEGRGGNQLINGSLRGAISGFGGIDRECSIRPGLWDMAWGLDGYCAKRFLRRWEAQKTKAD